MPSEAPVTGYVLKMYPRFSETFVVTEILAREAAGERLVIFSLRPPTDPRFHAELARVQAPVIHVERPTRPLATWEVLRTALDAGLDVAPHLHELAAASPDDAAQALTVATQARRHGVRHLHAHFGSMSTTIARLAAQVAGLPYSFTAHAKDIFHEDVDDQDLRRKLADAHHVVTVSDFNLRHLTRRFGPVVTQRLHRVYNGLDLQRFPYRPRAPRDAVLRIAAVGRLVEKKGFELLLRAVARLGESGTAVHVDVVGGGPLETTIATLRDELGLGDVVTMHGPLPQDDVSAVLAAADVFVAPCVVGADGNADGLPTVLLEAMATGVPCVASDVTGIPEVILDGETGLLTRTGDLEHLVQALGLVASAGFDPAPMTAAARALVEREFDAERLARDLASLERATELARGAA